MLGNQNMKETYFQIIDRIIYEQSAYKIESRLITIVIELEIIYQI